MSDHPTQPRANFPVRVAALADVAVVVVFVLVGRRTHHEDAGLVGFLRVAWPFAVGLVVAWLATGLFRAPLAWRRSVPAWILTVVVGLLLRIVVQGRDFKIAFAIVATVFLGVCMLGWRGIVVAVAHRRDRLDV